MPSKRSKGRDATAAQQRMRTHRSNGAIESSPMNRTARRLAATITVLGLLASACSSAPDAAPAGISDYTLDIDGADRSYTLFVPASGDGPAPLVLNFHGGADTAAGQLEYSGFNPTAETESVVVAYPDGVDRFWSFDDADLAFVDALLEDVGNRAEIDTSRIYAIGMSMGGDFASFLSCADAGTFAAIATVAVLNHHNEPSCSERQPIPVMAVLGAADDFILQGADFQNPAVDTPGPLPEELAEWSVTNVCMPNPPVTSEDNIVRSEFLCAPDGAALELVLHPGGHVWPSVEDGFDTNAAIWAFLSRFSLS